MTEAQRNFAEYVERWIKGESIATLARESGVKRSKFRRELTKAVGGKKRYRELREKGAGGSSTPPAGGRALGESSIDDSDVPVIPHARGWRSRIMYVNRYSTSVFIDPNGMEYVQARPNEKADLIVDLDQTYTGLGKMRLRKLEGSSLHRKMKKAEKERKRGEAALERQREQRQRKRAARRKRES